MKRFVNVILFLLLSVNTVLSQSVSGYVKDSRTDEGLPYATVQLLSVKDSGVVAGAMTNSSGAYTIKNIKADDYIINASYMGYDSGSKIILIKSDVEGFDFRLQQKSYALEEVSVTGERKIVENTIEKTTVNIAKNITISGGTAVDAIQTLPSVDVDINDKVQYRGSDKVVILINGEKSALINSLEQIPANQIEKIELINNPSVKYDAEGTAGIINIVLKSGKFRQNNTSLMLTVGYPETLGGNVGFTKSGKKTLFSVNAGAKRKSNFQTKKHLRRNYVNPFADNYYQYDRQDKYLNNALVNTNFSYKINKNQQVDVLFTASLNKDIADRNINYKTQTETENILYESFKKIDITQDDYTLDGKINYKYKLKKGRLLNTKVHYSYFDRLKEMNNSLTNTDLNTLPELQNTYSKQLNKKTSGNIDYIHPLNDSLKFETGYSFSGKDLLNDFSSESFSDNTQSWFADTNLGNVFNYLSEIHAGYLNFNGKFGGFDLQTGIRAEYTHENLNDTVDDDYLGFFPALSLLKKVASNLSLYASFTRRINRPTIKMLNPFSDEYADIMNMHKGNPGLKPEYVNSVEIGNRFVYEKISGMVSVYYRDIDNAISRVKSASNDSALFVTFINLDNANLIGSELALSIKPMKKWSINFNANLFYTNLSGEYAYDEVNNSRTGYNLSLTNNVKLPKGFGFQFSAYFRSKLPSVMGVYMQRYYADLAVSKQLMRNKARLVFKISDVFNTYEYGLDLDAVDVNNYNYSQRNRRKNESQYFILSFIYNIKGKSKQKTKKTNFFLEEFDK